MDLPWIYNETLDIGNKPCSFKFSHPNQGKKHFAIIIRRTSDVRNVLNFRFVRIEAIAPCALIFYRYHTKHDELTSGAREVEGIHVLLCGIKDHKNVDLEHGFLIFAHRSINIPIYEKIYGVP